MNQINTFKNKYLGEYESIRNGSTWIATQINTNEVYMRSKTNNDQYFVTMTGFQNRVNLKDLVRI